MCGELVQAIATAMATTSGERKLHDGLRLKKGGPCSSWNVD